MAKTRSLPPFRVGDRVRVTIGNLRLAGSIVEDRGNLGGGGRRLFAVRIPMEPAEPWVVEVPTAQLAPNYVTKKLERRRSSTI
jgi:hypothetical protein